MKNTTKSENWLKCSTVSSENITLQKTCFSCSTKPKRQRGEYFNENCIQYYSDEESLQKTCDSKTDGNEKHKRVLEIGLNVQLLRAKILRYERDVQTVRLKKKAKLYFEIA